ncbi:glycogen/starch synthase [uncultured Flavobacterium sp.]|uniref:glycogen synthase n=1 Tax=uncultured Flavobacterium sp. TaxID=165435 RepID=UPI0030813979
MIIHLASEVAPFYKRGGLGDVVGTLPFYLSKREENIVISFYYKNRMNTENLTLQGSFFIDIQNVDYRFEYYYYEEDNVKFYFLNMDDDLLFSDMESTGNDQANDDGRNPYGLNFSFIVYFYFAKATLQLIKNLEMNPRHLMFHDWHVCGCFAFPELLNSLNEFCNTVVLIHNYEHQGEIFPDQIHLLGEEVFNELISIHEEYGVITFFALAFKNANCIATVSKSYAKELLKGDVPHVGLKFLELINRKKIYTLPNGVDYTTWSPKCSPYLDMHYDVTSYKDIKAEWKKRLVNEMKFDNADAPIVLLMARLTEQKGINLLINLWDTTEESQKQVQKIVDSGVNLIIYGNPEKGLHGSIHKTLTLCKEQFAGRFNYIHNYTEEKAHQFLAGSDMILCPSLFEPCGLVQMYSMKFGTVPLVRPVGGLKDTVIPHTEFSEESTGFYIEEFQQESLCKAIRQATKVYRDQPQVWENIIKRGMLKDFSWDKSLEHYNSFLDKIELEQDQYISKY